MSWFEYESCNNKIKHTVTIAIVILWRLFNNPCSPGGEAEEGALGDHDRHLHEQRPAFHTASPHQVITSPYNLPINPFWLYDLRHLFFKLTVFSTAAVSDPHRSNSQGWSFLTAEGEGGVLAPKLFLSHHAEHLGLPTKVKKRPQGLG